MLRCGYDDSDPTLTRVCLSDNLLLIIAKLLGSCSESARGRRCAHIPLATHTLAGPPGHAHARSVMEGKPWLRHNDVINNAAATHRIARLIRL